MPECFIALGGNQGNVRETFSQALDRLNQHPEIALIKTSQWFETAPVGSQTDATFLNGAAHLSVTLSPQKLLHELQNVETEMGRNRGIRWSARPLDLDLILYDQLISDSDALVIPHPACWYRRFVLDPLMEIAPDVMHPVKKITIKELQQRLLNQPFRLSIAGLATIDAEHVIQELKQQFPHVLYSIWERAEESIPASEPTIIAWLGSGKSQTTFDSLPDLPRLNFSDWGNDTGQIVHILQSALDFH